MKDLKKFVEENEKSLTELYRLLKMKAEEHNMPLCDYDEFTEVIYRQEVEFIKYNEQYKGTARAITIH